MVIRITHAKKVLAMFKKDGFLGLSEYCIGYMRGIGYGTSSIKSEIDSVSTFLDPDAVKVCIDVGGNVGNYTAGLKKEFPNSTIYTFEPSATNITKLDARYKDDPNVSIIPNGLSDESCIAELYSNEPGSALGSLVKRDLSHLGIDFDSHQSVKLIRFESFWKETLKSCHIDVLKFDIEGHELRALVGCGDALDNVNIIQFEFGGCNVDTRTFLKDFWVLLTSRGFKLYRVTPFGVKPVNEYRERDEHFLTSNYIAVNKKFMKAD